VFEDRGYEVEACARFDAYFEKAPDGCWVWTASCDGSGYGQFGGSCNGKRWMMKAHLFAWRRAFGEVPAGRFIAHRCGVPRCVNPDHLNVVTALECTKAAIAAQIRPTRARDRHRFLLKLDVHPNGCWHWKNARMGAGGYGMFYLDGETMGAHRASHILFKGPIPEGQFILHSCDDRTCVNPEHLRAGTHAENMQESVNRARHTMGSDQSQSKLTEGQVEALRGEYVPGRYGEGFRLANKYGISQSTVSKIVRGEVWKHVTTDIGFAPSDDAPYQNPLAGEGHNLAKVTEKDVLEMRRLRAGGTSLNALAERFGVKMPQVSAICLGRAWAHVPPTRESPFTRSRKKRAA
jgi:hypothetical protein